MSSMLRRKTTKLIQSVQGGTDRWLSWIKSTAFKVLAVLVLGTLQLWLSLFLYGSFYYAYMPTVTHISPVYLQFSHCREFGPHTECPFPNVNTSLLKSADMGSLLMRGQKYQIHLDLEMPRSPVNENQGVFMVKLDLYATGGEIVASSFRPAMMHYQSNLLKIAQTLFFMPLLLTGYSEEKQMIVVSLMENYYDNPYKPVVGAHIELQARQLHIYSSVLRINAYFTGLRYLMYQWPLSTAIVFVFTFFLFLSLITVVSWQQCAGTFTSSEEETVVRVEDMPSMSYEERHKAAKKRMASERAALFKERPKNVTVVGQESVIQDDQDSQSSGISSVDGTYIGNERSAVIETIKVSHMDRLSDGSLEIVIGEEHDGKEDERVSSTSTAKVGKSQLEDVAVENQDFAGEVDETKYGEEVDQDTESDRSVEDRCEVFEDAAGGPVIPDGEELRKRKKDMDSDNNFM